MSQIVRSAAMHQALTRRCVAAATTGGSGTALFCARRFATSTSTPGSGPTSDQTVVEEDAADVLRRIQAENAAKAAALRDKAPPAPPRRPGKRAFFESASEAAEPSTAAAATTSPSPGAAAAAAAAGERKTSAKAPEQRRPPGPPRAGAGPLAGRKTTAAATASPRKSNAFVSKLNEMETDAKSTSFPTYDAAAEERRRRIEEKIKEERKQLLVFRDVGMDLDKPILSRDIFLVFKYFRYGMEFAVDNELERQLRYFNEHAVNELKIIQDSKLMRGPPTLSKKRQAQRRGVFSAPGVSGSSSSSAGAAGGSAPTSLAGGGVVTGTGGEARNLTSSNPATTSPFQNTAFPTVRCASLLQYCKPFPAAARTTVQEALRPSATQSSFGGFLLKDTDSAAAPPRFDAASDAQATVLTPSSFRRPAVVIYSQMGQKFGSNCDEAWRRLAYSTICPALLPYLRDGSDAEKGSGDKAGKNPLAPRPKGTGGAHGSFRSAPIDVVSLRSADLYNYRWVHGLYVRRLASTLNAAASAAGSPAEQEAAAVRSVLAASTSFVGTRLLEPFYTTLGLRNYLLPQVMLVDHEGAVRWLSGGMPDAYEEEHFPSLLRQLESEYYATKRAN